MRISGEDLVKRIRQIADEQERFNSQVESFFPDRGKPSYEAFAALARHILSRNPNDLANRYRRWGSWLHGVPLTHILLRHEKVLVDLRPMPAEDFPKEYGVTRDQFWMLAQLGYLLVNIRDYDSDGDRGFAEHRRHADTIGPVVLDERVTVYVNSTAREALFKAITGSSTALRDHHRGAFERFAKVTERFTDHVRSNPDDRAVATALFRREPPHIQKIAWNWAYYKTFSSTFPAYKDSILEDIDAERGQYDLHDPLVFADFATRLAHCHHWATAPLTGAYGGTYNMTPADAGVMARVMDKTVSGYDSRRGKAPHFKVAPDFLRFLADIGSERLKPDAGEVALDPDDITFQMRIRQSGLLNDWQFIDFLDFLRFNRSVLRRQHALFDGFEKAFKARRGNRSKSGDDITLKDFWALSQEAKTKSENALRAHFPGLFSSTAGKLATGGGETIVTVPVTVMLTVFSRTLGERFAKIVLPFGDHHREIVGFQNSWKLAGRSS